MSDTAPIDIVRLADRPEFGPRLAALYISEWQPWYGPDGAGNANADLAARTNTERIPLCLIALDEAANLLATASLETSSVGSELGTGPWLAAVVVIPSQRGRGIGTALVERAEAEALRLGFTEIFGSTDSAGRILMLRGWKKIGNTKSLRGEIEVYRKNLID
jgi:GNAT superfamily N-acetyltransferase